MALALFSLAMFAALAVGAFCAGWILHEQTDRDRDR